jgi:hypothetical protein
MSVGAEFKAKYGKDLDEMKLLLAKFKQNPEGFLESTIVENFGEAGLSSWKQSQEMTLSMSDSDKAALEKKFKSFMDSV